MWNKTSVTEQLNIRYPIIQGPFGGGLSTPQLTAAISNAGGLGSFGAHHLTPEQISQVAADIRKLTAKPFALNLWIPLPGETDISISAELFAANVARLQPYYQKLGLPEPIMPASFAPRFEDQLEAILEARPAVFSFVFGMPTKEILKEFHKRNIVTIGAVTTVEEALTLEENGVDLIVASGSDAGGHRPSFLKPATESLVGTFSLVPQVVDAVNKPVIAAGGIGDGRGIAAALTLGAEGVQLGTVFLASDEAGASEVHKATLVSPSARYTTLTRVFSGRYARSIRNQFIDELTSSEQMLPSYPIQNWFTQPIRQAGAAVARSDYLALWAGQAASFSRRQTASECFERLVNETEALMITRSW
jgi:nitronate monooxygenase